jgi:hypothetical protein
VRKIAHGDRRGLRQEDDMATRRTFLKYATVGVGLAGASIGFPAQAAEARPLLASVREACRRLAPLGWRGMLLDATGGELDIAADDLGAELARPLARIDRSYPGFGDFDVAGRRGIDPGSPDRSLLYHAFASPTVVANRAGIELGGFPTLAEIEAVEDYVYGVRPPTLSELRRRAAGRPLGVAVFALHYRSAPLSVHGRHAELCFSRSGIARVGSLEPAYDARGRNFTGLDEARPFDFRVVPRRFAAYLAVSLEGAGESYGPQDPLPGDESRSFWVPIHKLFSGTECIAGLDLDMTLACGLRNTMLADFHRFLDAEGLHNNWRGADLENFPFVIKDEMIGSLSQRPEFGAGVLEPRPAPLIEPAEYKGLPLTFPVDGRYTSDPSNMQLGSMQILPAVSESSEPRYMSDAAQQTQRPSPQYLNIRHRLLPDGRIDNLNLLPDMDEVIQRGGYQALHYMDLTGDGWVSASCPQLEGVVDEWKPAYCMVGLPDFFPKVTQRELMLWWREKVPKAVRPALWAIEPLALSQTRIAANIALPVGFSLEDTTITAIVSQLADSTGPAPSGPAQSPNGPWSIEKNGLPDGSPGLFDPGWDTGQGIYYTDPHRPLQKFLTAHGLGSPFVEDAKLCAALGNYWPGVAPDATRVFPPDKRIAGQFYPYPSIVPLTDEEIGSVPTKSGRLLPWDGVTGPQAASFDGRPVAAYRNPLRVDYIDLAGTMTASLTSRIDTPEYHARALAMEAVYWALGIRDPDFIARYGASAAVPKVLQAKAAWAVLSFRVLEAEDPALSAAEEAAGARLAKGRRYGFEVYRWGKEIPDPKDQRFVFVEMLERATAYVAGTTVLMRRATGSWSIDRSMPTS